MVAYSDSSVSDGPVAQSVTIMQDRLPFASNASIGVPRNLEPKLLSGLICTKNFNVVANVKKDSSVSSRAPSE